MPAGRSKSVYSFCVATMSPRGCNSMLRTGSSVLSTWHLVKSGTEGNWSIPKTGLAHSSVRPCSRHILRQGKEHRSEEHTSELQSLMRISYAVFCLKKKKSHSKKRSQKYNNNSKPTTS